MDRCVYKVCFADQWTAACRLGRYEGSSDDRRDGYIHLSTANQLESTLSKHFSGQTGLVLVTFQESGLGPRLQWEPSRGGQLFPHLYAALPTAAALDVVTLALGADGRHSLPKELR